MARKGLRIGEVAASSGLSRKATGFTGAKRSAFSRSSLTLDASG